MAEILCKYAYTLFPRDNRESVFKIISYETNSQVLLPDGTITKRIRAKGEFLPEVPGLIVKLIGEFEPWYDKTTRELKGYTFAVRDYEEEKPSEERGIIKYLETLDGVGKVTAKRLYDKYGSEVFTVLESLHEKIAEIKGISPKKAEKIHSSYIKRNEGRELFTYLYNYNIPDSAITKIYEEFGSEAIHIVKTNPYKLVTIGGFGFYTAEKIAQSSKNYENIIILEERIIAAILQVLTENETGGRIFSSRSRFPNFVYYNFLYQDEFDLLMGPHDIFGVTGNTCIPHDMLYLQLLKILNLPDSQRDYKLHYQSYLEILEKMNREQLIFLARTNVNGKEKLIVYKRNTATAEYHISKKIASLLENKVKSIPGLVDRISNTENRLKMQLSPEQRDAVYNSLTEPVSIITGGPGTGKTAVQKVLLATFETIFKNKTIVLAAPTGMAAKKMSESTGRPASTIHSLLGLRGGETYESMSYDNTLIDADLIIIDETSMVDNFLMSALLMRIKVGTQLVIVGDVDQLPSVGCGSVLKDFIDSNVIPTVRLTNIFRQGPGSSITVNAARIKTGETTLLYEDDFVFIEKDNTKDIVDAVKKLYEEQIQKKGVENVSVLSAYRKKTESGVNELNPVLRSISNKELNDSVPHFVSNGVTFYIGDKVMFTKNTAELINGDVGYIKEIHNDGAEVVVDFSDNLVKLEGEEVNCLVLAYATTVHKSQGSEYDTVIMIVDPAHSILLKKELLYTGITRAKKQIYTIGSMKAFTKAIQTEDSVKRRSKLKELLIRDVPNDEDKSTQLEIEI